MSDTSTANIPFSGDFSATFANFLSEDSYQEIEQVHGPRGGGLPKISGWQWLMGCAKGDGEPAFAHLCSVVLVELGTHQPLAAACGWKNQGELTLARLALAAGTIPRHCRLLGDRLFGTPLLIHELLPELESSEGGLLFRVKANMKSRLVRVLSDGSRLVDVDVRDPKTRKLIRVLRLREIHAEVQMGRRE